MKKTKSILILLSLAMLMLTSCSRQKVFVGYNKFDDFSWNRFNIVKFVVDFEDTNTDYDMYLNFRHLPEYPYTYLNFNFTINTSSGEMRTSDYEIGLFNKKGERLSECLGDYCDIKIPLRKGFRFSEPGNVVFEIENRMTKLETIGVLEVGLIIEKSNN